jgi:plasmid stabilization system protein ParE
MRLRLTEQAADQIAAINAYLVVRTPLGARNVQLAFDATFAQLTSFPGLGRRQRTAGVLKFGVGRYPTIFITPLMSEPTKSSSFPFATRRVRRAFGMREARSGSSICCLASNYARRRTRAMRGAGRLGASIGPATRDAVGRADAGAFVTGRVTEST